MFRKDQFGIVFNTIFSLMFAIFLPLYIDGSNMFREAGAILWGPLVQQLTKDFIPGFAQGHGRRLRPAVRGQE